MKASKTLLAIFAFGQCLGLSGPLMAQNQFMDERCQVDQFDPTQCQPNPLNPCHGECQPTQAQLPPDPDQNPTDPPETQQGCICDDPFEPQGQCQFVSDQTGNTQCADVGCPPVQDYNCDPASCTCGTPQEQGDPGLCQPNQQDPQQCEDINCSLAGGICTPVQGQGPDGQDGGGCHCEFPQDHDPGHDPQNCSVLFTHVGPDEQGEPVCQDLGCGQMTDYDCKFEFDPDAGILDCGCICDEAQVIPGPDLTILFTSKDDFEWTGFGSICSSNFNVYRQDSPKLLDGFPVPPGVANDYGTCLYSGLIVDHAMDLTVIGVPILQHYLVTTESIFGESGLGDTSSGFPRPLPFAVPPRCSTPPPMP